MGLRALLLSAMLGLANGLASTDTITWGGDNTRASYQDNHNMDPAVVASSQFGQIFRTTLPGNYGGRPEQAFSQPLVYTPSGSETQYVYYSTTQNNVYKINAKTGEIVLSKNLKIPFLSADLDGCQDISPHVGIIGTGVIDPATDTLYLTTKTYADQTKINVAQGRPAGRIFIHALDVNTLEERPNFPIDLEGTVARNSARRVFNGGVQLQRPGLLHVGNFIYLGFGSHCVQYEFTGWLIGIHKTTGAFVERFATQGEGVVQKGGSIWMSGGGLASDGRGSIFYATGNGYESQLSTIPVKGYAPPTALEEAAVHMSINEDGSLDLVDFFMPFEKQELDGADNDLGTSPLQILPSQFSCGNYKRIGVVTGKSGKTYWINLDDMGGYRNGPNNLDAVIQTYQNENSVYAGAGVYPLEGGYIYINVIKYPSHAFKFSCTNGVPRFTKVADSPYRNAYVLGVSHGTTTSLNGQPGTGLLWVTDTQTDIETLNNVRIFDAIPDGDKMKLIKSWTVPGITKFTRPVFGDGIMYFGTNQGYFYGYGAPTKSPLNCTTPNDFATVDIKATSAEKTITCKAVIGVTVTGVDLKEAEHFSVSGLPTVPLQLATGAQFTVKAKFQPGKVGFLTDDIVVNTTNSAQGYRISSSVRLTGTGSSADALFDLSPTNISFVNVISGDQPNDLSETVMLTNQGTAQLSIQSVQYSTTGASGPFETWTGTGDLKVGKFIVQNLPTTIAGNGQAPLIVRFDSTESGKYAGWVKIVSNGGTKSFAVSGTAGPAPVALLEFEKPDGSGWAKFDPKVPFTFGNVYQNTAKSLTFRITNAAPVGGVRLSLLVSKPPTGGGNLVRAANQVDLAEGVIIEPGESATAVMTCAVPKAQWNTDSYNGTTLWTMNTNDLTLGKQSVPFFCNAIAQQAAPLKADGQGRYRYIGCFKENDPGRQLANQLYGNDGNDAELCIDACNTRGNIFCGAQYHRECWSGNLIPRTKVDDAMCNYDCSGDIGQFCGGNGEGEGAGGAYISVFADSAKWNGNFTRPDGDTTTPPVGGPVANPGVNGYVHIGCYTEGTGVRALPNARTVESRTVANCVSACKAINNKYAGVEYGGECWCGNAFGTGAVPAPAKECNIACNNNATELCGGGSRLNVYQLNDGSVGSSTSVTSLSATASSTVSGTVSATASTTSSSASATPTGPSVRQTVGKYTFQGCYVEPSQGGRAIEEKGTANAQMTLEMCATFCDGYTYFGTEYGQECFCGNTLRAAAVPAQSVQECSFLCPGDPFTYCGAGSRLSLYKLGGSTSSSAASSAASVTSASVSASVSVSSTSSSASATPTGPSVKQVVNGQWNSKGCYIESTGGKALSKSTFADDNMTLEACATFCTGSTYFGVEYGRECYCGDSLREGAAPATKQTDCNFLCPGDKAFYCGAGNRLNLYQFAGTGSSSSSISSSSASVSVSATTDSATKTSTTSATASPSSTKPAIRPVVSGEWGFQGCYTEGTGVRALAKSTYADDTMTLESCATFCKGSTFFGVEYGRECYCGDALGTGSVKAEKQDDCSFLCPGDKMTFCGAGNRLQLYKFGDVPKVSSTSALNAASVSASSSAASSSAASSSASSVASASTSSASSTSTAASSTSAAVSSTSAAASSSSAAASSSSAAASSSSVAASSSSVAASSSSSAAQSSSSSASSSSVAASSSSAAASTSSASSSTSVAASSTSVAASSTSSAASSTSTSSAAQSSTSRAPSSSATSATSTTLATSTKTSTTSSSAKPSATGPIIWEGNSNFTYYACVSEPTKGRLMQKQILNDGNLMTTKLCAEKCWEYNYAGVEYGRECWCSNAINFAGNAGATPGKNVTDTECKFLCPGDNKAYCGAGSRMSMYISKKLLEEK